MSPDPVRLPAVAGRFYPRDAGTLARNLDAYLAPGQTQTAQEAIACVVPHAGYMYSGRVAGAVYRKLPQRSDVVIIGPNHFGVGEPLALMRGGAWRTPLGDAAIESGLAAVIQKNCPMLAEDSRAHSGEHSLEVQIPFLQRRMREFGFVPIAIGAAEFEALTDLGHGIARSLSESARPSVIIASSDMNHYEADNLTRVKDARAIEAILALDPSRLWDVVREESISMCGVGPVVVMLTAARDLGAVDATLEMYATSADEGAGRESVVGYAGIVVRQSKMPGAGGP
ncbi:MAG: AmmeMemoRadiSam system protein B [Acidobacteriota bacterium]|nr:AmmeMemoRadiSam system protein B [Acidobacteriota bacterium]